MEEKILVNKSVWEQARNFLKKLAGMPQEEIKSAPEAAPEQVELAKEEIQAAETPTPQPEEAGRAVVNDDDLATLKEEIADLQARIAALEAAASETKSTEEEMKAQQVELSKIVQLIAEQPSDMPPVKTESLFSKQKEKESPRSIEQRVKELSKLFPTKK